MGVEVQCRHGCVVLVVTFRSTLGHASVVKSTDGCCGAVSAWLCPAASSSVEGCLMSCQSVLRSGQCGVLQEIGRQGFKAALPGG